MMELRCRNGHRLDYANQLCNICLERMMIITDKDRLDFIEERARLNLIGVTFEWDGKSLYRLSQDRKEGADFPNIRAAIDDAINRSQWSRL